MTGEYFSSSWASVAPGVADHLWQSTLFAIAASLLALLLRKQNARARHWLWLAASLKFLFPFSLLVSIGSRFSPAPAGAPSVGPAVYFAMEEIHRRPDGGCTSRRRRETTSNADEQRKWKQEFERCREPQPVPRPGVLLAK